MDLTKISDEELAVLAKSDALAIEELLNRYKTLINSQARKYFLRDGDIEDITQEAMIGLFKAVTSFNGQSSFRNYAFACIKNNILTAVKKSNTDKNKPMIDYVSLSGREEDDQDKTLLISDVNFEPEKSYIEKEESIERQKLINQTLSKLENEILALYLQGFSYEDIANKTGKNKKAIDNALQRITKKLKGALK
ncbi:MAG: sigma-70 family RNA polymerase sigma factor [Clostridia bacterium]|nr:sigma-70 family RNA polymerase sigma factor [Clostridia bacterium]